MNAYIAGLGTSAGKVVPQSEAIQHAFERNCTSDRQRQVLARAYRLAGLESRSTVFGSGDVMEATDFLWVPDSEQSMRGPSTADRMLLYSQTVSFLALSASKAALRDADLDASRVTHLVTVTCTGFGAPGFDIDLIDNLELRRDIARLQVGFMGCHAGLNALRVARSIVNADYNAVVLVCAAEVCSLHFQYGWDSENIVANAIFADGAAACLVRSMKDAKSDDSAIRAPFTLKASGSYVVPETRDAMTWKIGDHGFYMSLSPVVPKLIEQHLPAWIEHWLSQNGLRIDNIESWAIHPGGPRILSAAQSALNLDDACMVHSREVFKTFGNMSSPTLLFILERMQKAQSGSPTVMLGFGPGLAIEATLLV